VSWASADRDVDCDSGKDSANGCWLDPLVGNSADKTELRGVKENVNSTEPKENQ